MNRWTTRLAMVAAAGALTLGLPAMGAAYGASRAHPPASRLDRVLARLDRLGPGPQAVVSGSGGLFNVDVRARADGWAVGAACVNGNCTRENTLTQHWNGARWARVPSPNPGGLQTLTSVSASSARNAWAVGIYVTRNGEGFRTLVEHWNGRRWARVPSPNPSASTATGLNFLTSVTAVSGGDAWAAGVTQQGTVIRPLILHWNGTRWSTAPSPRKAGISEIASVSAVSARDIWAVGTYGDSAAHALIEHWNGTSWRIVPAPARPRGQVQLMSVTALSARSAWAAGAVCPDHCQRSNAPSRTVILRWNGRRWAPAASPSPGAASTLNAVVATSGANAWAVGQYCAKSCALFAGDRGQVVILHWNGARWSRVAGPRLGPNEHALDSVSALSRGNAWAVGLTCTRNCAATAGIPVTQPLKLHWNGARWVAR